MYQLSKYKNTVNLPPFPLSLPELCIQLLQSCMFQYRQNSYLTFVYIVLPRFPCGHSYRLEAEQTPSDFLW